MCRMKSMRKRAASSTKRSWQTCRSPSWPSTAPTASTSPSARFPVPTVRGCDTRPSDSPPRSRLLRELRRPLYPNRFIICRRASGMGTEAETLAETHPFQAEVAELLRLMVHAVYSETDVFLRELISNASDACDKLRYEAIAKPELLANGGALTIRIKPDAEAGTLSISDTGIGMDRQELIDNLG